jgi:hypothetical protein
MWIIRDLEVGYKNIVIFSRLLTDWAGNSGFVLCPLSPLLTGLSTVVRVRTRREKHLFGYFSCGVSTHFLQHKKAPVALFADSAGKHYLHACQLQLVRK